MENKIDTKELEKQIAAFFQLRPVYEIFAEIMRGILNQALKELGMEGIVQARAKGIPNFAEKAIRKHDKYPRPAEQFTDLCGARMILDCKDDIKPISTFIRKHFEIDEANSEDVLDRLGSSQFGYLSVHFIVSLKQGHYEDLLDKMEKSRSSDSERKLFSDVRQRLYARRTEKEVNEKGLMPGAVFKAEIQLRTLLQHAWAVLAHDRVYKSEFNVPSLLVRDINRTAAALEEADDAFARTIRGVEEYRTNYGAYMKPEQRREELEVLETILKYDPDNRKLAHKMAQLWQSLEEWDNARAVMQPFINCWQASQQGQLLMKTEADRKKTVDGSVMAELAKKLEQLRNTEMSRILHEYGLNLWRTGKNEATDYLEWSIALDPDNDDARVSLAETHLGRSVDDAMPFFLAAYESNPKNPRALSGLLHCKVIIERNLDFVELLRPSFETAIDWCRNCAKIGVNLPYAYYDIGLFLLFMNRPCQSLAAYGKAVQLTESIAIINDNLERIAELRKCVSQSLPELDWIHRFLVLSRTVKSQQLDKERKMRGQKTDNAAADSYFETLRAMSSRKPPAFRLPVIIVAGGCDENIKQNLEEYRILICRAFSRFNGTVISGGTTAGIPGLIGDLPESQNGHIAKIGYLPKSIPAWAHVHPSYNICLTQWDVFTPLDSIQIWIDLITDGIDPTQVRLLGINGGELSDFEFKLALCMGAKVGVIPQTGRAAARISESEDWGKHTNLVLLPNDPQSVRIFVEGPPKTTLDDEARERIAKDAHEEYRRNQENRLIKQDAAMSEWKDLPASLKNSNLDQVNYIEEKLRVAGLAIRKCQGKPGKPYKFTTEQIEIMAEIEHARWNDERLLAGWRLGERDLEKRTSPYLTSWSELPENAKKWARQGICRIPEQLRQIGYEITPIQAHSP